MTTSTLSAAEAILQEIQADSALMHFIEAAHKKNPAPDCVKEGIYNCLQASFNLWNKLENNELDTLVRATTFSKISDAVLSNKALATF